MLIHKRIHSKGFSMIEILVTIVILSLGLLGLAALQSRGQQFNYAAHIRTQATLSAYDIMEKIRLNDTFAKNDVSGGASEGKGYVSKAKPANVPDCMNNSCDPGQLRHYDLGQWYDRLSETLPSGTGKISAEESTITVGTLDVSIVRYTITITWSLRDNEQGVGNETTHRNLSWMLQL